LATPASDYNRVWQIWGMTSRPDNFDELLAERYGVGFGSERNPYPVVKTDGTLEDPNQTNGGSGRLPTGFTQTRNADGGWSGKITTNCQGCHSTIVGTSADGPGLGFLYGAGGNLYEPAVASRDFGYLGQAAVFVERVGFAGRTRGTNNAQFSNVAAAAGIQNGDQANGVLTNGSTASGDTPAWWNVGHRPLKFSDGMLPSDAARVDMALFTPLLDKKPIPSSPDQTNAWVSAHAQDADHWILSLKSPLYPMPVDTALAEQGAILFHSKNLWAANLNNPVPKPEGGNGSCASCHGAYSPRYVNDPAYLDTPALEGVAAYISPKTVIGTDPARVDTYNEGTMQALSNTYVGYPETQGTDQDCGVQNRQALRGSRQLGYLAPPLYGVWATAPYFHNGSVPNVWEVLKASDRKPIWRRTSKPARADQQGTVVMGYDTNLQRAYDAQKLGWQYEPLACGTGSLPYLECDPSDPLANPAVQTALAQVYRNVLMAWNVSGPPILTQQQIEDRKIYNTHMYSQGNQGHEFTSVLTDQERRALIEYLKTL
jgi:mono/diheme cytochrome c family protein